MGGINIRAFLFSWEDQNQKNRLTSIKMSLMLLLGSCTHLFDLIAFWQQTSFAIAFLFPFGTFMAGQYFPLASTFYYQSIIHYLPGTCKLQKNLVWDLALYPVPDKCYKLYFFSCGANWKNMACSYASMTLSSAKAAFQHKILQKELK